MKELEIELKKLLDDPRTGLIQSSNTNKIRTAILGLFEELQDRDLWVDRKDNEPDKSKRILTYEEGVRRGVMICEYDEGEWRREDNEKISFFDLWQPLISNPK